VENNRSWVFRSASRRSALAATMLAGALASGCVTPPSESLGFPAASGVPTIDGVAPAAEWANAFTFRFEDGAPTSAASLRGMADSNNVYLYVDTADTGGVDVHDALVVAFNPTNGASDYRRFNIYPCNNKAACNAGNSNIAPRVEYATGNLAGSNISWTYPAGPLPAGVEIMSSYSIGSPSRWRVEIKLPKTTFGIPDTGFFGLFADAIATDEGNLAAVEYSWPRRTNLASDPLLLFGDLKNQPTPRPRWGNASLDPAAFPAGLQITGLSNIGADPSAISLTGPNEFYATAANSPFGSEPDATDVRAHFYIANHGLPNAWAPLPSATNPSPPMGSSGKTIQARTYQAFSSGAWNLTAQQQIDYGNNRNQCVRVDLSHTAGTPVSRLFNMKFVDVNSPYTSQPEISLAGWRRRFRGATGVTLTEHFVNGGPDIQWESRFEGAQPAGRHRWIIPSLQERSRRLNATTLPSASLKLPADDYRLDPAALFSGSGVTVAVRPNSVVTLLGEGELVGEGFSMGAAGLGEAAARRAGIGPTELADSLRGGEPIRPGALIGSFDGFETSFAIGTGTTLYVPEGARSLSVRLAGKRIPVRQGGLNLQAIPTDVTEAILADIPLKSLVDRTRPVLLPLGINLPMHIVRGTLDTGQFIRINDRRFRLHVPMGSYGEIVKRVAGSPRVFAGGAPAAAAPATAGGAPGER